MSVTIKAWVVRNSAFAIQCGGLQRLFIHFSKPMYVLEKLTDEQRDLPWDYITVQEGFYARYGWISQEKIWVSKQSVGSWLGYNNPVSDYIWKELEKHFHNEPFDKWDALEKEGKSKVENFCLEIELEINIKL